MVDLLGSSVRSDALRSVLALLKCRSSLLLSGGFLKGFSSDFCFVLFVCFGVTFFFPYLPLSPS